MTRVAVGLRFGAFLTFLLLTLSARAFDARGEAAAESTAPSASAESAPSDDHVGWGGGSILSEGDMTPVALSALEEGIAGGAGDRASGRQAETERSERAVGAHADPLLSIELVIGAAALRTEREHRPFLDEVMACARRAAVDPPCATA